MAAVAPRLVTLVRSQGKMIRSATGSRFLVALLLCLIAGAVHAQEHRFGARISTCVEITNFDPLNRLPLCSVSGFYQVDSVGIFAQTRPVAGPFYDHWQIGVYYTDWSLRFDGITLDFQAPGIAVGREGGGWRVFVTSDIVASWSWSPTHD